MKRIFAAILVLVLLAPGAAFAAYPEKPINHIVPAAAGGGWDRASRIVTDEWGAQLGQPFKFDYVPGASGMIGMNKLRNSGKQGYATAIITFNMVNIAAKYQKDASIGWNDLAFVGNIITDQNAVFVHKDSPFNTLRELIDYGKTASEPLKVGGAHPTAVSTLAARLFIERTGIKATLVAFNGGAESRKALAGKHLDVIVSVSASAVPMKDFFKGLGVFAKDNKAAGIFDMPPVNEALPGMDFPDFLEPFGVVVSREFMEKRPEEYARLVAAFKEAMHSEGAKKQAETMGMATFVDYWSPEECEKFAKDFDVVLETYASLMQQ